MEFGTNKAWSMVGFSGILNTGQVEDCMKMKDKLVDEKEF